MNFNILAEHYYVQESGILLYSEVNIIETIIDDPDYWVNHSFVRELKTYPDFFEQEVIITQNDTDDEEQQIDLFEVYFSDPINLLAITGIIIIIIATSIAIWVIHRKNIRRQYEEFKKNKNKEEIRLKKRKSKQKNKN